MKNKEKEINKELKNKFHVGVHIKVSNGKILEQDGDRNKLERDIYGKITHHNRVTAGITGDHTVTGVLHGNVRWEDLEFSDKKLNGPFGPLFIKSYTFDEIIQEAKSKIKIKL